MFVSNLLGKCFGTRKDSFDEYDHSEHGFDFVSPSKAVRYEENKKTITPNVDGILSPNQR